MQFGRRRAISLAALLAGACGSDESDPGPTSPPRGPVRALTYNVKTQVTIAVEPARGSRIAEQVAAIAPDLIALAECNPCRELVEQLPGHYELADEGRGGVNAAYDASRWQQRDRGFLNLGGEDDDGWGQHVALWVEFEEKETGGGLLFYSTHWCTPNRYPDDLCDLARQLQYAGWILEHAAERGPPLPVVVAGDLNFIEGTQGDAVPAAFTSAGYVDALRAVQPEGAIVTYDTGVRLDYIFASAPVEVTEAFVDQTVPWELGSDHWPVAATVVFE